MARENRKHVFIAYRREDNIFVDLMRERLERAGLRVWMDTTSMEYGAAWKKDTQEAIRSALAVVLVMSPDAKDSENVTFEWTYALGAGVKLIPVMFIKTTVHPHLEGLQWLDFTYHAAPPWDKLIEALAAYQSSPAAELTSSAYSVVHAANRLAESEHYRTNICFQHLINQSLLEMGDELLIASAEPRYKFLASQYPRYLTSLQRHLNARVKALALVNVEERFWPHEEGDEIRHFANRESKRVFAFLSPEHLDDAHLKMLKDHALRYSVYAIDYTMLASRFGKYAKDIAIIEAKGYRVLAEYDDASPFKNIVFSVDLAEVAEYDAKMDEIVAAAVPINPHSSESIERFRRRVFGAERVEMSGYIPIDLYDRHEERHAYYQEMMDAMLEVVRQREDSESRARAVLELGAGTGIFTKRLLQVPGIECVATEIDWQCFDRLSQNLRVYLAEKQPHVEVHNEDSCTFQHPLSGTFACVFSSFADHHIGADRKGEYLENVRRNLARDGLFIVGDEFLPPHDEQSREARHKALETYHGHIIDIAIKQAIREADKLKKSTRSQVHAHSAETMLSFLSLAQLEKEALVSGIEEKGDFKVTCERYEAYLSQSGFEVVQKVKIGPVGRDELGGVYVFVARPQADTVA